MTEINLQAIESILRKVGEELPQRNEAAGRPDSRAGMHRRFDELNGWAEREIRSALTPLHPDICWSQAELDMSAQEGPESESPYWVLDPIDGAVNLIQGFPFWSISLCLVERGQAVFGVIYDAVRGELFHAQAGGGAYLNGMRIAPSGKKDLDDSVLLTSPPGDSALERDNAARTTRSLDLLLPQIAAGRMLGSVALQLAYIACGRADGYIEFGSGIYDWLAGALLIREAGGIVTDAAGRPFDWGTESIAAAGTAELAERMAEAWRSAKPS
ncbi:inositol monophosphatase [Saccharibacillus sp. O23]|uniref:inositol monophosphatase family protein n=1 Tax=Saccharibacillus sp. O23 TaxID=2009338 RepID=UPI000B4DF1E1|nr:inositol monophosphatase family protein [Saccharibacillus sp. O23]OWR29811.1 inositol monophosphatase [Saccharibacillus sp. O23]